VLLVDEIDRADDEFEAFLLELLGDWAITIPEVGTIRAERPPVVVITSNRTRDVHDALKRRCLYHWIDHPTVEREAEIIRLRVPEASDALTVTIALATERLRSLGLYKPPGVAEAIDWTAALVALGCTRPDEEAMDATLGAVVKYHEDLERVRRGSHLADAGDVVDAS
jgi:MoxR-like ATPase